MHLPLASHPQVRVEHEFAFEADEEVLAMGVHAGDRASGKPLRPAVAAMPGMRRRELVGSLPGEHGADAICRVVDGVAFRHGCVPGYGEGVAGSEPPTNIWWR